FYLRGKNVIWVSDLVYRLKDNARLFFIVSIISAVAFTATGVLAMYKSTVGAEESAYEMEYLSYSGNPKEQTHLKDIDHELKTHGFTYKKDKINVSYVRYQEGDTVPPVYMISESDVSTYFHVKLNGLKHDEAVYFPSTYDRNFKNKAPDQLKLLNQKGKPSDQKLTVKEVEKPLISLNAIIAVNDQTFDQLKSLGEKASLYG
ncbi:ABC transporter permease, partial [Bacillus velezensis]